VRLALLVAGTTLPLIIFAAGIIFNNYAQDRRDATQRVLETVRSIRLVLDAEMQRMTGGLQVLALTNSLRSGDFNSFRRIAAGFLDQNGKDGVVLVADSEGRQLFSSLTADVANLPPRNNRDIVEKVFATKRPYYSNLFVGVVKKTLMVTVEVPVIRDGEDWEIIEERDGRKLRLLRTEAGGPHVTAPVQRGFGSRLIERSARDQLGGEATVDFLPRGVVYTLTSALEHES
jgi:hypothetical protein